jgi:hypothetical protein
VPTENNRIGAGLGRSVYAPGDDVTWTEWAALVTDIGRYLRFERDDLALTIHVSEDAQAWTEVVRGELPEELRCEQQNVVFSGSAWFIPAGSYADYDYVRFQRID